MQPSKFCEKKVMITAKRLKETKRKQPALRRDFLRFMVMQLAFRRRQLGLSGADLDAITGWTDSQTAKYERGIRGPSAFNLFCWAEALGCQWVLVPKAGIKVKKPKRRAK